MPDLEQLERQPEKPEAELAAKQRAMRNRKEERAYQRKLALKRKTERQKQLAAEKREVAKMRRTLLRRANRGGRRKGAGKKPEVIANFVKNELPVITARTLLADIDLRQQNIRFANHRDPKIALDWTSSLMDRAWGKALQPSVNAQIGESQSGVTKEELYSLMEDTEKAYLMKRFCPNWNLHWAQMDLQDFKKNVADTIAQVEKESAAGDYIIGSKNKPLALPPAPAPAPEQPIEEWIQHKESPAPAVTGPWSVQPEAEAGRREMRYDFSKQTPPIPVEQLVAEAPSAKPGVSMAVCSKHGTYRADSGMCPQCKDAPRRRDFMGNLLIPA